MTTTTHDLRPHGHGSHDHPGGPHTHGDRDHHGTGSAAPGEHLPAPSTEASVVMDIGGSVGGAVVFTPASMLGAELEIRAAGTPWRGTHTAVRERQLPDGVRYAGLFGSLGAGPYELRVKGDPDDHPVMALVVEGGRVVQADWPGQPPPGSVVSPPPRRKA